MKYETSYRENVISDKDGNVKHNGESIPDKRFNDIAECFWPSPNYDPKAIHILPFTYITARHLKSNPDHYSYIVYPDGTLFNATSSDVDEINRYLKLKTSPKPYHSDDLNIVHKQF